MIDRVNLHDLKENKYIRTVPKLSFGEHEEVKSYIVLQIDDFLPTENPHYRNCTLSFIVMCHLDY